MEQKLFEEFQIRMVETELALKDFKPRTPRERRMHNNLKTQLITMQVLWELYYMQIHQKTKEKENEKEKSQAGK